MLDYHMPMRLDHFLNDAEDLLVLERIRPVKYLHEEVSAVWLIHESSSGQRGRTAPSMSDTAPCG